MLTSQSTYPEVKETLTNHLVANSPYMKSHSEEKRKECHGNYIENILAPIHVIDLAISHHLITKDQVVNNTSLQRLLKARSK